MKQVVFVGGTSYSGSTFLHLMIGNDPRGFACGEIRWLFNPHRPHHANMICGCGQENCRVWGQLLKNGSRNLYQTIFEMFPEVEIIADSSKNPFWIRSQMQNLASNGISAKQLLIWKTPLEFAHSAMKRGHLRNWYADWVDYHRLYFSLIHGWRAVKYFDLATDTGPVLEAICQHLGIPFFPGKEEFWKKTHHVFGGNRSAKFHLYPPEVTEEYLGEMHDDQSLRKHRTIYYSPVEDQSFKREVQKRLDKSRHIAEILHILAASDVLNGSVDPSQLRDVQYSSPLLMLREIRYKVRNRIGIRKYMRRSRHYALARGLST